MSPELKEYLTTMLAWANAGIPYHIGALFNPRPCWGLCDNLTRWCQARGQGYENSSGQHLRDELEVLFVTTGVAVSTDDEFPFNGDHISYMYEYQHNTVYTNPKRLAWLRQQVEA